MRLETPNAKQDAYDRERTLTKRHERASVAGTLVVFGAIALSLFVWYFAYLPAGAPNSGSTSTSAEVDPADTVGPKAAPKPGVDPDGR
jgi:hypothetical protein